MAKSKHIPYKSVSPEEMAQAKAIRAKHLKPAVYIGGMVAIIFAYLIYDPSMILGVIFFPLFLGTWITLALQAFFSKKELLLHCPNYYKVFIAQFRHSRNASGLDESALSSHNPARNPLILGNTSDPRSPFYESNHLSTLDKAL